MAARPLRYEVNEAEKILIGVTETHAMTDARLEVRGAPRHVERHHALVRVPDVDHAVELRVR